MRILSRLFTSLLLTLLGLSGMQALAASEFAITAPNTTMPGTGNGKTQYTVTGVPESGGLAISCSDTGPADPTATAPFCWTGLPVEIPVNAGQTVTGTIYFLPPGSAMPGTAAAGMLAAGALLFGFGLRREKLLASVAVLGLGVVAGLSGCGGGGRFNGMTPGTYNYTVSAVLTPTASGEPKVLAQTTVSVTVP